MARLIIIVVQIVLQIIINKGGKMNDGKFIMFQDDFYNLLEKYSRNKVNCEHKKWNEICKTRNDVANFIDILKG